METEYKVTKVKAALRLYENKDQIMEVVREFEERAESLKRDYSRLRENTEGRFIGDAQYCKNFQSINMMMLID